MDIFFREWWNSGREDPEEFASLVQQYADAVRMIEREECAKVCENMPSTAATPYDCADDIRERSNAEVTGGPLAARPVD